MGRFSKFLHLSRTEQTLLLQAMVLLASVRLGLYTLPFATLRNILSKLAATSHKRDGRIDPDGAAGKRIIWAVEMAGRQFPFIGTCLTQALAAHVLLARQGHQSNLRIGVTRDREGKFVAHAWLEQDGVALIGGTWSAKYTPMPALNGLEP